MAVMVAVPDSEEGLCALEAAVAEAQQLGTELVVVNLTLGEVDLSELPAGLNHSVVGRSGRGDRHPAETVLRALSEHPEVERLVIGVARRSPVGKLVLGSVSQQLILEAEVPVLAVKLPR